MSNREKLRRILDEGLKPEPWCVDRVDHADGVLDVYGWALAPEGRHADVTFTLNGKPFDHIEYPIARPDVGELFWYKSGADRAAFHVRSRIPTADLFASGEAAIRFVDGRTGQPVCAEHTYYWGEEPPGVPLPEPARRKRVCGSDQEGIFRLEGFTTFKKLDLALRKHVGKSFADFPRILDWGCGCGRVTRYFSRLAGVSLTGADIDQDNLNWCRTNLPFAQYHPFPLQPRGPVGDSAFDLVLGVSVFTHLREPDHLRWLEELRRITAPGAVLLLTVLGTAAVCRTFADLRLLDQWKERGFLHFDNNVDLKGHIDDEAYYVTALITEEYVRRVWSKYFEVAAIVPAYIGNQQDLVVLRRRA